MGKVTTAVSTGLFIFGLMVLFIGLLAWGLMALSGALGHAFDQPKLYISFQQAFLITLLLSFVGSFFRGSK